MCIILSEEEVEFRQLRTLRLRLRKEDSDAVKQLGNDLEQNICVRGSTNSSD
jgi:hypothetical protein